MSEFDINSQESTIEDRPHVSALLWESVLGVPFELRKEDVKTRGRPRKYLPIIEGQEDHKLSDVEPELRQLLPMTIHKIILDYKEYVEEGLTPKLALEEVCKLYSIPYGQAFNIVVDEL
jgi:hypothetical protein